MSYAETLEEFLHRKGKHATEAEKALLWRLKQQREYPSEVESGPFDASAHRQSEQPYIYFDAPRKQSTPPKFKGHGFWDTVKKWSKPIAGIGATALGALAAWKLLQKPQDGPRMYVNTPGNTPAPQPMRPMLPIEAKLNTELAQLQAITDPSVRRSYWRKLALEYHPDKHPQQRDLYKELFQKVNNYKGGRLYRRRKSRAKRRRRR